ncbi:hypothetical protein Pmani_033727, partial [Petrolisthes manimaculis]
APPTTPSSQEEFRVVRNNTRPRKNIIPITTCQNRFKILAQDDDEDDTEHGLVVEAASGEWRSEAEVEVQVEDINDNPPTFPSPLHQMQLTEGDTRHLPKTIVKMAAKDEDSGGHSRLLYTLSGDGVVSNTSLSSSDSFFSINPSTGDIYLMKPLERDPPDGRGVWRLRVAASDGWKTAHTTVLVTLRDVNDNAPSFPTPSVTATVSEDAHPGPDQTLSPTQFITHSFPLDQTRPDKTNTLSPTHFPLDQTRPHLLTHTFHYPQLPTRPNYTHSPTQFYNEG